MIFFTRTENRKLIGGLNPGLDNWGIKSWFGGLNPGLGD